MVAVVPPHLPGCAESISWRWGYDIIELRVLTLEDE
jgi:hypothetical protein